MQEMGNEFAHDFPKVAGRLGMEGLECADPYVERLLEGFAFMTARVQLKIEEEFPKFCQHLLEMVYPDYLAPLPSMTIVNLKPDCGDADLAEGFPDYFFFRYWSLHAGLVVTILYAVLVIKLPLGWKDFWRAIVATQLYLVFVHLANISLGSNYSYTMHKPHGASILDVMGEWPWYILAGEGVMIILFFVFLFPYLIIKSVKAN